MKIDWSSLSLVAITTVIAAIAIVGIFSVGVVALTGGAASRNEAVIGGANDGPGATGSVQTASPGARMIGYACVGIAALLVLYGLYLIIPQFH